MHCLKKIAAATIESEVNRLRMDETIMQQSSYFCQSFNLFFLRENYAIKKIIKIWLDMSLKASICFVTNQKIFFN